MRTTTVLLAAISLLLASATWGAAAPTPNIVIIFIDDMGYGDIGPFGATKQKTPRLDRMATEGMKFTNFYAPVCSVSRAQLLTGCYGARVSVPGVYGPRSANGLNPAEQTIAERLKECGYTTMCIGKWHVGDQPEFLPTKQGFERFLGQSANGRVGDWIEEVDGSTGQILDTLTALGIAENTLVIFTSDNGPWLSKGKDSGSAGPLRGGKGSTWEGGVRVPTLAWWPGRVPAGATVAAVTGTIDLLPTVVALAGGTLPADPVIDGRGISPVLLGKTAESPRGAHYYFSGYRLQAVREGLWKLALSPQNFSMGMPIPPDAQTQEPSLYNLDQEIGERTNVAAAHPAVVARLAALADKMTAAIGGDNPTARRPAGKVANPAFLYPAEQREKNK